MSEPTWDDRCVCGHARRDHLQTAPYECVHDFHCKCRPFRTKADAIREAAPALYDALRVCAEQLAHCLGPDTEAGRAAQAALARAEGR